MDENVRAVFNEAADKLTAWREQQWEAMTKEQKKAYECLEAEHRKKRKERMDEFYRNREKLVEKEKQRVMLSRPELVLRMLPGRLKERRAIYVAGRNVQGRHEAEMKVMDDKKMKALDECMRRAEKERTQVRDVAVKERFAAAVRDMARGKERSKGRGRER
ncbi:MAG: hypothetical protein AB7R40_23995 [Nitrospiraceae bacterium]